MNRRFRFPVALAFVAALAIAGAWLLPVARAQTAPAAVAKSIGQTVSLSWTAPTAYTTGAAIASGTAITYNVYDAQQSAGTACSSTPSLTTQVATGITAAPWVSPALATAGVNCYTVTAVVAGVESGGSNVVQVNVTQPATNPPTGLTAQ